MGKAQFAIGVNEVTRVLERMKPNVDPRTPLQQTNIMQQNPRWPPVRLQAVVVAADCKPRMLTKHIPGLAALRNVPVVYVGDNKRASLRLGELLKLKTALVIGVKVRENAVNQLLEQMSRVANELDSIHFSIKMASKLVKEIGRLPLTNVSWPFWYLLSSVSLQSSLSRNSVSNEMNCLLECSQCLIKVHQACYGVSRVPKGDWYCRPCKEDFKNIVCVLCGYGCGAMTRALRSQTIIKSLLKVCRLDMEQENPVTSDEVSPDDNNHILILRRSTVKGVSVPVLRHNSAERSTSTLMKKDTHNQLENYDCSDGDIRNLKMLNNLIEGLINSSVKQCVHMVCGLWTPGTRCQNVDTMSAFDVSGVSCPRPSTVCSLCNRRGGSCIKCRVLSCKSCG